MVTFRNSWGVYLLAGAGLAAGALCVLSLTRKNKSGIRKACVSALSYGLDLKDKVCVATEFAKESAEDVIAEARYASEMRKSNVENASVDKTSAEEVKPEKAKTGKKTVVKRTVTKAAPKTA